MHPNGKINSAFLEHRPGRAKIFKALWTCMKADVPKVLSDQMHTVRDLETVSPEMSLLLANLLMTTEETQESVSLSPTGQT